MESWTEEEARAYLPRLRVLVAILRRAVEATERARGNGHLEPLEEPLEAGAHVQDSAGRADVEGEGVHDGLADDESPSELGPREALEELTQRGIIVRDPSRGLVDFPSTRPSGRVVLLCWQAGEEDLAWWHLPEDGFAGRRPLPIPSDI